MADNSKRRRVAKTSAGSFSASRKVDHVDKYLKNLKSMNPDKVMLKRIAELEAQRRHA